MCRYHIAGRQQHVSQEALVAPDQRGRDQRSGKTHAGIRLSSLAKAIFCLKLQHVEALGGSFAYLGASDGESGQDAYFTRNFASASEAGLQVGAVHGFDPCRMADGQSANFVTMVPRDKSLLPPVIELKRTADGCACGW